MALSEMEVLSAEDAERRFRANEQYAIGQEQARRRKLSDLQASPEGQAFMKRESEAKFLQANPKLQQQFILEREKSRLRKEELAVKPAPRVPPTPFESEMQRQTAKDYAKITEDSQRMGDQLDLTKKAIGQFRDYSQGSLTGTGPFATLGGITKYVSSGTEALESVFRTINLKNMVATFSGMSRAIDTDAERRAWEATQPGITLDDPTNAQILVGGLSLATKTKAEGDARRKYIESSPDKTLKGYQSPIIGKTTVLFNPEGEPVIVPKEKAGEAIRQGLMTDKEFENQILGVRTVKKRSATVESLLQKYSK